MEAGMKPKNAALIFLMEFTLKYTVSLLVMLVLYAVFQQQMDWGTVVTIAAGLLLYDLVKLAVVKEKVRKIEAL
jgi:hypothetical protein